MEGVPLSTFLRHLPAKKKGILGVSIIGLLLNLKLTKRNLK